MKTRREREEESIRTIHEIEEIALYKSLTVREQERLDNAAITLGWDSYRHYSAS